MLRRLFFLVPPVLPLVLGTVAALVYVGSQLSLPTIAGFIIDQVVGELAIDIGFLAAGLALAALISAASQAAFRYVFAWWGETATAGARSELLRRMPDKRIEDLEERHSGEITALYIEGGQQIGQIFHTVVAGAVLSVCQLVLNGSLILWRYGAAGFLAFALIPFYVALPLVLAKQARRASTALQEHNAVVSARVQEAVESVREVKLFSAHGWLFDQLQPLFLRGRDLALRLRRVEFLGGVQYWLYWTAVGIVYWQGAREVAAGNWSVGALVAFVAYLGMLEIPCSRLATLAVSLQPGSVAAGRVFAFLDAEEEEVLSRGPAPTSTSHSKLEKLLKPVPAVEFRDVTFTYRGVDRAALAAVTFRVEPGQVAAIVGPSGAGKSTLAALLLRLYEPDSGEILLDGFPVSNWPLKELRRRIAIVGQRPLLFKTTVKENISLGRADSSLGEIQRAALLANAHEFIEKLPQGYETDVGERGNRLSVGQAQRIAIARTLHNDPEVLILDEAMSSQDSNSESAVRAAISELMRERTTLIITHRLASISEVDVILLMEHGKLVDRGSHATLIGSSSLYRHLVEGSSPPNPAEESVRSLASTRRAP